MPDIPQLQAPVPQDLAEDPLGPWTAVLCLSSDSFGSMTKRLPVQNSSMVAHHPQVQVYPFSLWPPPLSFLSTAPCCPDLHITSC